MNPVIAVVGRANVGKSTLFNKLIGQRRAIVHDQPGVTRDRIFAKARFGTRDVSVVDTGGLDTVRGADGAMQEIVGQQVRMAVKEADLVLFVFDGRQGLTALDEELVSEFRTAGKAIVGVVNKVDPGSRVGVEDFYRLGLKELCETSSEHNYGIDALKTRIEAILPVTKGDKEERSVAGATEIAFLGRPNVGKSSLINAILGEPRLAVSEIPGTTRDMVDTLAMLDGTPFRLLDTAGIRRRGKVVETVEHHSAVRALRALERAHVAVLVIDASEGITTQDQRIASEVVAKGCGLVIAANKWDLLEDSESRRKNFREGTYVEAPFLQFAALRFVSAKTGLGVEGLLTAAHRVRQLKEKRFTKSDLEPVFEKVHGSYSMHGIRLFGLTQGDEKLPTFHVWCNDPRRIRQAFEQYWTNQLSERLRLEGVPLRIVFRRRMRAGSAKTSLSAKKKRRK